MNTKETWDLIKEKQEELRQLTDQNWRNGEWELAALGERTLRTVSQSAEASRTMRTALVTYQVQCARYDQLSNS